jgi:hypothetical protein
MTQELHACERVLTFEGKEGSKLERRTTQIQMTLSLIIRFQKQLISKRREAWALKLAMHIEAPKVQSNPTLVCE